MPASVAIIIMNLTPIVFELSDTLIHNASWEPDLELSRGRMICPHIPTVGRLTPVMPIHGCSASLSLDAPPIARRQNESIEIGFGIQRLNDGREECWVSTGVECRGVHAAEHTVHLPQESLHLALVHILRVGRRIRIAPALDD